MLIFSPARNNERPKGSPWRVVASEMERYSVINAGAVFGIQYDGVAFALQGRLDRGVYGAITNPNMQARALASEVLAAMELSGL